MKNIDKMKQILINRIKQMSVEEYENFAEILYEQFETDNQFMDKGIFFRCDDCRKIFGKCTEKDRPEECHKRFQEYSLGETDAHFRKKNKEKQLWSTKRTSWKKV